MSPLEIKQYLDGFINYEIKVDEMHRTVFKLDRVRELLRLIGDPQDKLKFIHIAGTKGKGSTCAFTVSILRSAGYRVGLYTSPHLHDYKERIRILVPGADHSLENFEGKITDEELRNVIEEIKSSIEALRLRADLGRLSFFEVYTAIAIYHFWKRKVDFAVLETGLGGRLDATNIVHALICAITPISLEHTQLLGSTVTEIAKEKAGIIKHKDQQVIIAPQLEEAQAVLKNHCRDLGVKDIYVGKDIQFELAVNDIHGQIFHVQGLSGEYRSLKTQLLGRHQAANAAVTIGMIEMLQKMGHAIARTAIYDGIEKVVWPGRFEIVQQGPLVICDGAHNPASCRILAQTVEELLPRKKITLIVGISEDKDRRGIMAELKKIGNTIIITQAQHPRAYRFSPEEMELWGGQDWKLTDNVTQAIDLALRLTAEDGVILVTGSFFVVAEAREICISSRI